MNDIVAINEDQIDLEMVKKTIAKEDPILCNLILPQDQIIPDVNEGILIYLCVFLFEI